MESCTNTTNRKKTHALAEWDMAASTTHIRNTTNGTNSGGSRAAAVQGKAVPCGGAAGSAAERAGRAGLQTAEPAAMERRAKPGASAWGLASLTTWLLQRNGGNMLPVLPRVADEKGQRTEPAAAGTAG